MFPFGAIGAGPRRSVPNGSTQRFTWSTQWLHLSQRLLSTFFKETYNFCSAPFRLSFSCWMSFTTRGPIWNPTKTENEFPSRGKLETPGKTSQQWRLNTYRDHTRTESFMKTSTEDFDTCDDFDWTFRCLGVRTSLQLRATCHCHLGPWSPDAGATLKTPQKITKQE